MAKDKDEKISAADREFSALIDHNALTGDDSGEQATRARGCQKTNG